MEGFLKVKNLFELGTRTLYLPTSVTSFPDLSICPSDPYHMENLIKNGIKSIDDYRFKHTWNSNNISKSAKDLYKEVVINVEKIVARIDINLECQYNGSNILTLTSFDNKLCYNQTQRAKAILNKISNIINKTYTGLISVLQGFQKCIA